MATVQAQNEIVASISESEATHVLVAQGVSGNWAASLDESLTDQASYRLQLESPSVSMSIPLHNIDEFTALSQWLQSDAASSSSFTLEVTRDISFRICQSQEAAKSLSISFGGFPFLMMQTTLREHDARELCDAIADCLADLHS